MWDILRFLKNPEGDNLQNSATHSSAESDRNNINEQIMNALERTEQAVDEAAKNDVVDSSTVTVGESTYLAEEPPVETQDLGPTVEPQPEKPPVTSVSAEEETLRALVSGALLGGSTSDDDSGPKESPVAVEPIPETTAVEAAVRPSQEDSAKIQNAEDDAPKLKITAKKPAQEKQEKNEANLEPGVTVEQLLKIPISQIRPNPFQPRKVMGENEIIELSESIKELGVLQPIIVKKVKDGYELIAGERRLRASQRAGLTEIPAVMLETEPVTQQVIALVENIQRKNLTAIEEALCLQDIISKTGWSQTELSRRMGRSQASIANKLRLLRLDASVQDLVIAGKLGERQARSLLSLSMDEQRKLAQKAIDEDLSARALELLAENWNGRTPAPKKGAAKNASTSDGPGGELLGDLAALINRHRSHGISAQWKVKQMNQNSLIVEISVDLASGRTAAHKEAQ